MLADDAIVFSYKHTTPEGAITLAALAIFLVAVIIWVISRIRK